jgi:MoxR-like ATPase
LEDEKGLLLKLRHEHPVNSLLPVADASQLVALQRQVWEIHVDDTLQDYIVRLVTATRGHPDISLGASPRASLALFKSAQALAAIRGRDHVIPDDIQYLVPFVMTHRLLVSPEAELRGRSAQGLLQDLIEKIPLHLGLLSD